jgi:uncharacterized protein (TIGR03382 family)
MKRMVVLGVVAAAAGIVWGHGEGDIGLLLDGDRIVTALADDESGEFTSIGERVFGGEIDFVSNVGDGPGFFTTDGPTLPGGFTPFAAGTTISYQTNGAIMAWDGASFVSTSNRLRQIQIPGVLEILSPTDGSVTPGFEYAYSGGDFDEHPDYAMEDGGTPGIFLWSVSFAASDGSGVFATSDFAWVVFNFGMTEEEHELALEWAEANIPSPGALAALGLGLAAGSRRRR